MYKNFCLLFSVFFTLLIYAVSANGNQASGTFTVVKGDVQVVQGDKSQKARVGQKVHQGDTVVAGKDSRAKIVMSDKNEIHVSPESKVSLATYIYEPDKNKKEVLLNVIYGKIRSSVQQKYDDEQNKFRVKTPTAVAGVRGTDFLANFQPQLQKTEWVTFRGEVRVGTIGAQGQILNAVIVGAGQTTVSFIGKAPEVPKDIPKNELASLNNESSTELVIKNNDNGSQPDRAPSSESDKKSDKKDGVKESTPGPKNNDVPKPNPAVMLDDGDMGPDVVKPDTLFNNHNDVLPGPPMYDPYQPRNDQIVTQPDAIRDVIQDNTNKGRLIITITQ